MRDLAAALGRLGASVDVYAADCWGRRSVGDLFEPPTRWITARGLWLGGLSWSPGLKPLLDHGVRNCDVAHLHSIWMLPNSYASRSANKHGKPVVITAHGTLEPWALRHSRLKKRIIERWFQRRDLERASCIQVNSRSEIEGIREYGLRQPVAVIPNGIDLREVETSVGPERFLAEFPQLRGKRLVLFLGRLHQKKGLGLLLPAWGRLATRFRDWHLVVAGPDRGFEDRAKRMAAEHRIQDRVTFVGPLLAERKASAYTAASLFVLPSYSEGFSMALLEAAAWGLPSLITPGCNFPELAMSGGALISHATVESVERELSNLLSLEAAELSDMGARARDLVREHYTWDDVARKTLALYLWLGGAARRPTFVDTVDGE